MNLKRVLTYLICLGLAFEIFESILAAYLAVGIFTGAKGWEQWSADQKADLFSSIFSSSAWIVVPCVIIGIFLLSDRFKRQRRYLFLPLSCWGLGYGISGVLKNDAYRFLSWDRVVTGEMIGSGMSMFVGFAALGVLGLIYSALDFRDKTQS